ncbi:MAG: hypothetical protein EOO44_21260, partial [Flavobacterium sp.]
MNNHFYAILDDGNYSVRRIELTQSLVTGIQKLFVQSGETLIGDNIEDYEFDGNYTPEADEVLFVEMKDLPGTITDIRRTSLGVRVLDFSKESIKALLWYDQKEDIFYFQSFDNRKRLDHKFVLFEDKKMFNQLSDNAFIVEDTVHAVYSDGRLYFKSYANANKILPLGDHFKLTTEEDIQQLAMDPKLSFEADWLIKKSNSTIKKLITKVEKAGILARYETTAIQLSAKKAFLDISLDEDGKIIFPKDIKQVRA